jgi:diguanylate cyclase (GGDEF)-like protein/PAS domain S-box-containing protein
MRALAGGACVLAAYYLLNSLEPQRFPQFFGQLSNTVAWGAGLALLVAAVLVLRSRQQLADALRESEKRLRTLTDKLRAEQERLESALDGSNVALWEADLRTGRVYLSEAWAAMVGGQQGETVAGIQELIAMLHPDDVEATLRASVEAIKGKRPVYAAEHRVRSRAGEWKWVLSRGRVTERDPHTGRAVRMVGTNVDITDRKRIEEAVQSVWRTDPLTGLANRGLLDDRLKTGLARARRSGGAVALLYLDIDHFKQVNDSLGHSAGDALLKAVATRLLSCVRSTDTVARLGGDEFVVLLEELHDPEDAATVSRKILETMRAPVRVEDRELAVTVCCQPAGCRMYNRRQ